MPEKTIAEKAGATVGIGLGGCVRRGQRHQNSNWHCRYHGGRGSEEGTCQEGGEEISR